MRGFKLFSFHHSRSSIFFACIVILILVFWGTSAHAETFLVSTLSDSGPGSLRAAIASADSYDDVISFAVTGTITLNSTLEISGDKGMKIQGPGADLLAVSGNDTCRVFYINTTASVDISGISIENGHTAVGGGIYNDSSSPSVTNCTFSENSAVFYGGGMYNDYSSPSVTNCTFSENSSAYGGGIYNDYSSPSVTNCTLSENSAVYEGGGMYNLYSSSPTLTNCTLYKNSADSEGGGMYNFSFSTPTLTNCTLSENSAGSYGGGMCNFGSPIVTNCILWNAAGGEMYNHSGTPTLSYCVVQSDDYGTDTIISGYVTSADPMLQLLADNGGPTWTCALGEGSSAIDAGIESILIDGTTIEAPDTDQRGVLRPQGSGYDIGAYEYEQENNDRDRDRDRERNRNRGNDLQSSEAELKELDQGGEGGGCNISATSIFGILLILPLLFLYRKMK